MFMAVRDVTDKKYHNYAIHYELIYTNQMKQGNSQLYNHAIPSIFCDQLVGHFAHLLAR